MPCRNFKMEKSFRFLSILFIFLLSQSAPGLRLYSQDINKTGHENGKNVNQLIEDGRQEIEFYSLEELLDVEVDVASLFTEDELVVASSASSISSKQWRELGAKRTCEALMNELSIIPYNFIYGATGIAIRGYATAASITGTTTLLDGIPCNAISLGTSTANIPNWELGTLDKIELIKGPGSAIYGTDAFHGVISMKTFESDRDQYFVTGAGAYPFYGDAGVNISQGIADNLLRIDFAAGLSHQGDQDIEYEYESGAEKGKGKYNNKYDNQSGVLKATINPADKLKIRLGAYANHWDSEDFNNISYDNFENSFLDDDVSSGESSFYMGNFSLLYTLPRDITVEGSLYHWQADYEARLTTSRIPVITEMSTNEINTRTGTSITIKQPDNNLNTQWLLAYSYNRAGTKNTRVKLFNGDGEEMEPPFTELPYDGVFINIHSMFGQFKWNAIKDVLFIIGGGRIDNYSNFGNQFTPRGGIIFQPVKNSAVKALYGRAFRAPASTELYGQFLTYYGNRDLQPQTIDVYELIYIYKEKSWKFNITGFYSKWENGIVLQPINNVQGFTYTYANEGKNRSLGGEIKLFYSINPFAFDLGFAYVKSEALDIPDPYDSSGDRKITRVYDAFPEYTVIGSIWYMFKPLGLNFFLNNRLYFDMYEYPEGVRPAASSGEREKITYYRMDLSVSRMIADRAEIALNIRNILNMDISMPSMYGAEDGYMEPGISALLRISYKF